MRKSLFLYALVMAGLIWFLKVLDYRFLVRDFSWELYVFLIAMLFSGLGIWAGNKLTKNPMEVLKIFCLKILQMLRKN